MAAGCDARIRETPGAQLRNCVRPREEERLSTPTSWTVNPEYDQSLWFDNLVVASWPWSLGGKAAASRRQMCTTCLANQRRAARAKASLGALETAGKTHAVCERAGLSVSSRAGNSDVSKQFAAMRDADNTEGTPHRCTEIIILYVKAECSQMLVAGIATNAEIDSQRHIFVARQR